MKREIKIVAALMAVILVLATGAREARATLVDSNSITKDGIEYYIQADKSIYDLGEDVEMLFRITNWRTEEWSVTGFFPIRDIIVEAEEGENFNQIWYWTWNKPGPAGPVVLRLQPNESAELNGIWPQIDLKGTIDPIDDTSVPPGIYRISGVLYPTDTSVAVNVTIIPEPATVVLLGTGLIGIILNEKRKKS